MAQKTKRRRKREPVAPISWVLMGIGTLSIILYFIFVFSGASGTMLRIISGFSFILMIACIVSFILGIRQFSHPGFATLSKVLSILIPAAGMALWIFTYFFGILAG